VQSLPLIPSASHRQQESVKPYSFLVVEFTDIILSVTPEQ
jgi:hypothetical protein